jgi:hypothetical protein
MEGTTFKCKVDGPPKFFFKYLFTHIIYHSKRLKEPYVFMKKYLKKTIFLSLLFNEFYFISYLKQYKQIFKLVFVKL